MPRPLRLAPPNSIHHVINRGNDRRCLFDSAREFDAFIDLMVWARECCPIRILAYCLMPNHWHLILWPEETRSMSAFLHRLCTTHALRWRRMASSIGHGHVYQGRYHAFLIDSERYYFNALRYVEANPRRAGLVASSHEWQWSSLAERRGLGRDLLTSSPLVLPPDWVDLVDEELSDDVLAELRPQTSRRSQHRDRRN